MKRARLPESLAICLLIAPCILSAAIITFDDVVIGETSFGFDGAGDGVDDVTFSTTDADGFNVVGPSRSITAAGCFNRRETADAFASAVVD